MPTIAIEATTTPPQLRRRVARTLTGWLAARGVPAEHVVTRFRTLSDGETFAGAVPLTWALSGQLSGSSEFAFVTCTVSAERDPAFRKELAVEVTRALQPEIPSEAVFIAIHPIDPADHFRGGHPAAPVTDSEEAAP
jgi:phenylpyruvate tautomerase PptA (4-oxalocrotonate tautomerase family)